MKLKDMDKAQSLVKQRSELIKSLTELKAKDSDNEVKLQIGYSVHDYSHSHFVGQQYVLEEREEQFMQIILESRLAKVTVQLTRLGITEFENTDGEDTVHFC